MYAQLKNYSSPVSLSTSGEHQGVFLKQGYNPDNNQWNPPYYTVKAESPQPVTINGKNHNFYFQNWEASPSGSADFQHPDQLETPVVFNSAGATVKAVMKGTQLSNTDSAFANSGQRKFVRTSNGNLHLVYESLGKAWYEISTDNGYTWQIANGGQPLSGSNESKLPAIDYKKGSNTVVIVWQEKDGGAYDIKIAKFSSTGNYMYGAAIFMDAYLPYSANTNPVVSWDGEGRMLFMWKRYEDNAGYWPTGIVFSYGALSMFGWNEIDFGLIPNTNSNSINPTLATDKTNSIPSSYHLAWEQTSGSYSYIKYYELYRDGYQKIKTTTTSPQTPSRGAGFWTNRKPSIIVLDDNTPRLVWVGFTPWYLSRAVFRAKQTNGSWSSIYNYNVSGNVESVNINRTDDGNYALSFCDAFNGSQLKYVKNSNLWQIRSFRTTGKDVQVGNAANFNNMYAMAFQTNVVPYRFSQTRSIDSNLQKGGVIASGRQGVVYRENAEFYFAIGDVYLGRDLVEFTEVVDTTYQNDLQHLNTYLQTKPFEINNNSSVTYSVLYGLTDSLKAAETLQPDDYVNFKVELIDAQTGNIIGAYDDVTYTKNSLDNYNNIAYVINTEGVGNRTVKLRLVVNDNLNGGYGFSKIYGEETALGKFSNPVAQNYQGSMEVKQYSLTQNYPNPFNPTTQIKYQIPNEGFVTLKVYDILGRDVATLVKQKQSIGRYQSTFDASLLAAGVYIYRLTVHSGLNGNFSSSKKMLLLK